MSSTTVEFLRKVLPEAPYYAGGVLLPSHAGMRQKVFTTIEELAHFVTTFSAHGYDTYYGLSGFKQSWHEDPNGRINAKTGKVKKVFRTQANACRQKAFWLDIDCGEHKAYASKNAARDALIAFLHKTKLPCPVIVSSGNGLHCYWPLTAAISTTSWEKFSACLDALTRHYGLQVDPSRTMDAASILRPPGTRNYKSTPKDVKVLVDAASVSTVDLCNTLVTAMKQAGIKPTKRTTTTLRKVAIPDVVKNTPAFAAMANTFGTVAAPDKDASIIISECQQIREAGMSTEPVWFGMMKVMSCCVNGKEYARQLSAKDTTRHNNTVFNEKYEYASSLTGGPALCTFFDRECPGKCTTCPHWGAISSPAELGRQKKIAAPVQIIQDVKTYDIPELDSNLYEIIPGHKIVQCVYEKNKVTQEYDLVSKFPIMREGTVRPLCAQRYRYYMEQELYYIWLHERYGRPPREVRMTVKDFQSAQAMRGWLYNNGLLPDPAYEKEFTTYMRAYLAKVQHSISIIDVQDHYGWVNGTRADGSHFDGFVLGDTLYAPGMPPQLSATSPQLEQYTASSLKGCSGSLEEWKKVPELYNRPGQEWGQFGMCLAFGSIFMKFMPGNAKNGIVNFYSVGSGPGKSTLQEAINSVWGHPHDQLLNVIASANARYNIMSVRRNLPICIEEVTNMDDRNLSELLFIISEGIEKATLTQDRSLRKPGQWQAVTIMSANNTVLQKMINYSSQRTGELMRALDVEATITPADKAYIIKVVDAMANNYGVAGRVFIQYLMEHPTVLQEAPKFIRNWIARRDGPQSERFWDSICAAAVLGGTIACAAGLLPYDMKKVNAYCLKLIKAQRRQLMNSRADSSNYLADYLADKYQDMLIVASARRNTTTVMPGYGDEYVKHLPRGALDIRYEMDTHTIYVRAAPFRKWCREHRLELDAVLNTLILAKQYTPPSGSRRTTKYVMGQDVESLPPERQNVFKFTLSEDLFGITKDCT